MNTAFLLAALLLAFPARAEHAAGGGSDTVSVAAGELIYVAVWVPGGVNRQLIVRRLATNGGVLWEQGWGRGRGEEPTAIATTSDGGVVVAGAYKGGCFIARFDAQGRSVWEASPSVRGLCRPAGVVTDGEGSAYLLATVDGGAGYDGMVWKLGPRGDVVWTYRYSSNESLYAQSLFLDPRGDLLRAFVLRKRGTEYVSEFFHLDALGRRLNP